MNITGLIWLEQVVNKIISKHRLEPNEVEEVFLNKPQYRKLETGRIQGEHVYAAYGQNNGGRYITVRYGS